MEEKEKENYKKKIEDYEKALKLNPSDADIYNNIGWTYSKLEEHEKSLENYEKALKLNPNKASTYFGIGWAYSQLGNYKKSLENFEKALKLNPNDASTYHNIGWIYGKLEEYEKSLENYEEALKLNPNRANTYYNIGWTYSKLNQYEKSLENYKKALRLSPNDADIYNNIGWTYEKLNQNSNALEYYQKAVNLDRSSSLFKNNLKNLNNKLENKLRKNNLPKKDKLQNKEKENFQSESSQEESKEPSPKKFLTFADILGWKGIWQRDKSINKNIDTKRSNLSKMKNIKNKLEAKEKEYSNGQDNIDCNITLISDTFIVASDDIKIHNKLCKDLISFCLKEELLIRGATAYGEYLSEEMIYIGEAVDEAASWHELAEEVSIFYTISARLKLEEIMENMEEEEKKEYLKDIELINSEVQLKKGKMGTYLISWIDDEENRTQFKEIMKKEIIYPELALKYLNTEKQINNFLKK